MTDVQFAPPVRLGYLVSHPIQYHAPLLRRIAAEPDIDLTVLFCSDVSVRPFRDEGFARIVEWDVPLLEGYRHLFLPTLGPRAPVTPFRPLTRGIGRILKDHRFEALWVHSYARLSNMAAILAARRAQIPVLLRDDMNAVSTKRSALKREIKRAFLLGLDRLVAGYLATGSANRDYYRSHGIDASRIFPFPYAVDNARFRNAAAAAKPRSAELKRELGIPADRLVASLIARLVDEKDPDTLLAAWRACAGRLPPERRPFLIIVGDGPLRARMEASAADLDTVRFVGFRNQGELPKFYALTDLLVLPSRSESWGLMLNEAMNAGCAIIASDAVAAARDLVRDGVNGAVFPVGSASRLADLLGGLLSDPARLAEMGRHSLALIENWGFEQDVGGLRAALASTVRR